MSKSFYTTGCKKHWFRIIAEDFLDHTANTQENWLHLTLADLYSWFELQSKDEFAVMDDYLFELEIGGMIELNYEDAKPGIIVYRLTPKGVNYLNKLVKGNHKLIVVCNKGAN